ncbi:hypothetical protein SDJN02_24953, partial [Cucurbita argyrosperma subsp. argyrosperma]
MELEIRRRSADEWSFLCTIWEPHKKILKERCDPCKTRNICDKAHTVRRASKMHKEQTLLTQHRSRNRYNQPGKGAFRLKE